MLSCLNGALEYYRTTGERHILEACLNAWKDIVDNRLYLTGAASYGELFHDDYDLPNVNSVGETCVTVTWLQFNAQLLRLTGEARFAEQLEHVILNQLFGAQRCDGAAWGYYVEMEGKKPYSSTLDGHCCLSSGPRGVALIPTFAVTTDADGVVLNLYDSGIANLELRDKTPVKLTLDTHYPSDELINIQIEPGTEKTFSFKLRVPAWCQTASVQVNRKEVPIHPEADGYVTIRRNWTKGDAVQLRFKLDARVVRGDHKNEGKIAVIYGPLVLAADEALLPKESGVTLSAIAAAGPDLAALHLSPEAAPPENKDWPSAQVFRVNAVTRRATGSLLAAAPLAIRLTPFADAGSSGTRYKVWLPLAGASADLLVEAEESRSRRGNMDGSIVDDDIQTAVVTFDGKSAAEDWFAVTLGELVTIRRIVFVHGKTFHDGGWFDASGGKPRVQVKLDKNGAWETVGELTTYPATTATELAGLRDGQQFSCSLKEPMKAYAIRIVGKPACGDNPQQAFSSCAELQAFSQ
jgi:hypothetical protein